MDPKYTRYMYIALGVAVFAFAITFFPNPGITGHVSVEAGYQPLNMQITQSQKYLVTTDYEDPLMITSLRLSGEVIGDGKAEVIIDNGIGQRLTIYTNEEDRQDGGLITGMGKNQITGLAVGEKPKEKALLNLVDMGTMDFIAAEPREGKTLTKGKFANMCADTCLVEMELSKESNYVLEIRVSEGTILKLDNMIYGILLQ